MKVLWLCNIMLPAIAEELGLPYSNREGWLTGIYGRVYGLDTGGKGRRGSEGEAAARPGISGGPEIGICFPVEEIPDRMKEKCHGAAGFRLGKTGAVCYAFRENLAAPEKYDADMEVRFREILEDFRPDMVHVFGTEFPHALAMVRAFRKPERTLVGIQGLCFACAEAYLADLPEYVVQRRTFRDVLKRDGILQQQEKFRIRGEREKEVLKGVGHITGRTDFDRTETGKINPKARYHFMDETMRTPFYEGEWKGEVCRNAGAGVCPAVESGAGRGRTGGKYGIFLSQGDYPLKGFHYVLQALPEVRKEFPQAYVMVAGNSVIEYRTWKDRIKISSYGKYLRELISSQGLEGQVRVLGKLSAEEMKAAFLEAGMFVCPSSLENSPNSMGEAMLLGVPVAAARTGGIPSMIEDGREGLLFEAGNVKELAECIKRIWREPEKAAARAGRARERAFSTHDGDKNYERLLAIYREICQ